MHELVVRDIHKWIGNLHILKGVSLELRSGEVLALLGHSGSGKTTILRCVAGLERPNEGRIALRDKALFDSEGNIEIPPEKRGFGMVFQSYALWPDKTVRENVSYGLKLRRMPGDAVKVKADDVLGRLGLESFADRYPHQLSGGQQQRVALARALVYQPPVLLLDEPLSNLDAKLREEARAWVRELILQANISALYVTHDQVEAMAVSDRIMLLRSGAVEQEGTPQEIYGKPRTLLAADFMGSNNRIAGVVGAVEGEHARLDFAGLSVWGRQIDRLKQGQAANGLIRIERTRLTDVGKAMQLPAMLEHSLYLGERWEHVVSAAGMRLRVWDDRPRERGACALCFDKDDLWLFV